MEKSETYETPSPELRAMLAWLAVHGGNYYTDQASGREQFPCSD